jgi:hypothetical protein
MSDDRLEDPMLGDLKNLAQKTASTQTLEGCTDIAAVILQELDISGSFARGGRIVVLNAVLTGVALEATDKAFAAMGTAVRAEEDPVCRAAAAAELLGLVDEETFQRRRREIYTDKVWNELLEVDDNKAPKRRRELRAGVWIDGQSTSRVRHRESDLLTNFAAHLLAYVASHREELTELVRRHFQPATTLAESPALMPTQSPYGFATPPAAMVEKRPARAVGPSLQGVVEKLADQVRRQIEAEQRRDGLGDTAPLSVRWTLVEDLADQGSNIWGDEAEPVVASETFDTAADLFESIPSGRLVILGRGGAGKTVLARQLALELLRRRPDGPVPVIFRLPSWDLSEWVSFGHWMIGRLLDDYPGLRKTTTDLQGRQVTAAEALVAGRHILPILDGLDEIAPPRHRVATLKLINDALEGEDHLVLTCRPTEYATAVSTSETVVNRAAVVELRDLTSTDLAAYLPRKGREATRAKWDPVLAQLRGSGASGSPVLREALATPLMASLARTVYSKPDADPAELLDASGSTSPGAISDHLLNAFVETRYSDLPQDQPGLRRPQWKSEDARRWLGFIAVMMSAQDTYDFAWWRPEQWRMMRLSSWPARAMMILSFLLAVGSWLGAWLLPAGDPDSPLGLMRLLFIIAMIGWAAAALAIYPGVSAKPRQLHKPRRWQQYPGSRVRTPWRVQPVREAILFSVIIFLFPFTIFYSTTPHIIATVMFPRSTGGSLAFSITFMVVIVLCWLTCYGFISVVTPGKTGTWTPTRVLREDRRATVATGLYYGVILSLICGTVWVHAGHLLWLAAIPALFAFALIIAACLSSYGAWRIRYSGFALPFVRWLPRPSQCMDFLDDACHRGVLRQDGGLYQFRHALLQEQLAADFLQRRAPWVAEHRTMLYARSQLALSRLDSGASPQAVERELRDLITEHQRRKNQHGVLWTWDLLIRALRTAGRHDDALTEAASFQRHLDGIEVKRSSQYWHYQSRRLQGDLLMDAGRPDEAISNYAEALRMAERYWGQGDQEAADVRRTLAELRDQTG